MSGREYCIPRRRGRISSAPISAPVVQRWRRVLTPEENICAENNNNYGNMDAKLVPVPQTLSPDF
jgi:hypothetical protein